MSTPNLMGNMLESDSSTDTEVHQSEMRTDGDGMESIAIDHSTQALGVDFEMDMTLKELATIPSNRPSNSDDIKCPNVDVIAENALSTCGSLKVQKIKSTIVSPRQLPPRDQLIPLKPTKPTQGLGTSRVPIANPSYVQFTSASLGKQKNPKFIPYEPYSGATRAITDEVPQSPRRPSSSLSSTKVTASTSGSTQSTVSKTLLNIDVSPTKLKGSNPLNGENANSTFYHSMTLLKERLKIAEKDIHEVHLENARLKKMLVDSLSGAGSHEMKCASLRFNCKPDSSGNTHSLSESFDNLNDEIEVWRSKFLSSCVLVEQLSKENQNCKEIVTSAIEIFRDIKNETSLTPILFNQINQWVARSAAIVSSQSFDETLDADDDNSISV